MVKKKKKPKWWEGKMEKFLLHILNRGERSARSFDEAGVMTMNKGVVVTMADGSVFQLTIVDATR